MALFDYPVLRVRLAIRWQSKSALFQNWPLRCPLPPPWHCTGVECEGWGPCLSFGGYFSFPGTQNKRTFDVIHLKAPSCICYGGSCWALNKITTSLVISQILILFRTHIWRCTFQILIYGWSCPEGMDSWGVGCGPLLADSQQGANRDCVDIFPDGLDFVSLRSSSPFSFSPSCPFFSFSLPPFSFFFLPLFAP